MPSQTLHGIVLRYANYRDHDRMLTLLTPEQGKVDALLRGCRRPKSPMLPVGELFVHGEFVLYRSGERYTVTSCAIADAFYPLRMDTDRLVCATYLLGLCQAAAQPAQPAGDLYDLLLRGVFRLAYCTNEEPHDVTAAFLLMFANTIGYRPRLEHCVHCGVSLDTVCGALLDIPAGGLVCDRCAAGSACRLRPDQLAWVRRILQEGFPETGCATEAAGMLPVWRRYVESRLETTIKAGKFLP